MNADRWHMMFGLLIFWLILLSLTLGCCGMPYRESGILQAVAPAMSSVVEIRTIEIDKETPQPTDPMGHPTGPPPMVTGNGSGIVVDPRGYLLTCYHVIRDVIAIHVDVDRDHLFVDAAMVACDPLLDLALVKVDLPLSNVVRWGNSQALLEGDLVFAVGFPFDTTKTAEIGIISSLHMVIGYPVLVTDAAINPGHSGGGLFNERGELVGINNMIYCPHGLRMNVGLAFCIPGNTAHLFVLRNLPTYSKK